MVTPKYFVLVTFGHSDYKLLIGFLLVVVVVRCSHFDILRNI